MNNSDLFQEVKDLKLPMGKFALFGSAPLGIRGLRECHDIDLLVADELWNEKIKEGWEIKTTGFGNEYLCKGNVEMGKDWGLEGWNVSKLIADAEVIDGLPFVRLESVLKWKKMRGREKDLKDIEMVENYLRTQE